MKRVALFAGLAIALFLTLVLLETLQGGEEFDLAEFAFDLFEMALLATAVVATSYVSLEMRDARRERETLIEDLVQARAEGDRWREAARVHIDGLGQAIRSQFAAWRLSAGEADVAFLMLKGLSHKEIARLRNTSEATVRQQAASVYDKSGLASRAELAAYFLEDLFAPGGEPVAPKLTVVEGKR